MSLRLVLILLLVLIIVDAQYRMMANYGPAWRQRLWRKTRTPSAYNDIDTSLSQLLGE